MNAVTDEQIVKASALVGMIDKTARWLNELPLITARLRFLVSREEYELLLDYAFLMQPQTEPPAIHNARQAAARRAVTNLEFHGLRVEAR